MRAGARLALALATTVAALAPVSAPAAARGVSWPETECLHASAGETRTAWTCGATIARNGRAVAPPSAPATVRDAIAAANRIARKPYVWGGGHLEWWTKGYDCSGAVGYALHGAGLLDTTMVSGQLAYWGEGGPGRWITVYANEHHVYMVVAGLRFDTRGDLPGVSGPRWHTERANPRNFAARHPAGL